MGLGKMIISGVAAVVAAGTVGNKAADVVVNAGNLNERLPERVGLVRSSVKASVGIAALFVASRFLS